MLLPRKHQVQIVQLLEICLNFTHYIYHVPTAACSPNLLVWRIQ
ncbi:hypothetical protein V6Z11_A13G112900 [Gossypium hirsutum]